MARGKKGGPSRMDLRRQAEAAESREVEDEDEVEEEETEEEESEDGEAEDDSDAEAGAEAGEGDDDDDEGGKKKPKKAAKKKAAPKAKKTTTKRVRAAKEIRQRAVWIVFDNSSKEVGTFNFNQKKDAENFLEKKIQEKEGKATFYLNLVKREIKEEK